MIFVFPLCSPIRISTHYIRAHELDEVKSESREVRRENLMLEREQKGLMNLLRRHGIDPVKEQTCEQERDER